MKLWKKIIIAASFVVLTTGGLAGCSSSEKKQENNSNTGAASNESTFPSSGEDQLAEPVKGDTLAVFHIKDYGDITVKLFPKGAPKAVENFVTHAKDGYYNGVIFHRVINDFMIQGGDPNGIGNGGESIWGKNFEDEFAENLMPIRGSLCMANAGQNTNGSQFFIVQTKEPNLSYANIALNDKQKKMFEENGGASHLIYEHTVFGQVVEGMDVVDKIAATRTDAGNKPLMDVVIESIDITEQK